MIQIACRPAETVIETFDIHPPDPSEPSPHGIIPQYPVSVKNSREKWAFLMSQYPARRRHFVPNDLIHPYIITHRESWFQLACQQFHKLRRDDFVFISGQVETRQWAVGISQRPDTLFTLVGKIGDEAVRFVNRIPNDDSDARAGPDRPEMREHIGKKMRYNPLQDQSIFLNFFKARTRLIGAPKIVAMSEPPSSYEDQDHDIDRNVSVILV